MRPWRGFVYLGVWQKLRKRRKASGSVTGQNQDSRTIGKISNVLSRRPLLLSFQPAMFKPEHRPEDVHNLVSGVDRYNPDVSGLPQERRHMDHVSLSDLSLLTLADALDPLLLRQLI